MVPSSETQNSETLRSWLDRGIVLLIGITFGWLGLYLSVIRPLHQQMIFMHRQIKEMNTSVESLVGAKDDVYKTSDLLTLLKQQNKTFPIARESLNTLTEIRGDISNLKAQLDGDRTRLFDVQNTVNQFKDLKHDILSQKPQMDDMQITWKELKNLQLELASSRAALSSMMNTWIQIQKLHQELIAHTSKVKAADNVADSLLNIEAKLAEKTPDMLNRADQTLNQLFEFQIILDQQSQLVPQSLRNMETLGELELEFTKSVNRIQHMRRDLLDIALLEQSVKDALKVLSPVMELTNAKRLKVEDVREVARNLEERRNTTNLIKPSFVSHQGEPRFDSVPPRVSYWEESPLRNSKLLNSEFETPVIEQIKPKHPPTVDLPEQ